MAGFSNENKPLAKLVEMVEERLFVILSAVGPLGVAVSLNFFDKWWDESSFTLPVSSEQWPSFFSQVFFNPAVALLFFSFLTLYGVLGQAKDMKLLKQDNSRKKEVIDDLKKQKSDVVEDKDRIENNLREEIENNYQLAEELVNSFRNIAHLWTCQIFNELCLTVKHRISIYYLDSDNRKLVLLDRFAKNPEYNRPGRPFFSKSQGVIGKAWAQGEFFEKRIPLFNRKNTNYYQYLHDNYGFSRDVSSKLNMKSCTVGGFAIEDSRGHHIGVIIFESEDQNDFEEDRLREIVRRENYRLVEFITDAAVRDIRPLSMLGKEGGGSDEQEAA